MPTLYQKFCRGSADEHRESFESLGFWTSGIQDTIRWLKFGYSMSYDYKCRLSTLLDDANEQYFYELFFVDRAVGDTASGTSKGKYTLYPVLVRNLDYKTGGQYVNRNTAPGQVRFGLGGWGGLG